MKGGKRQGAGRKKGYRSPRGYLVGEARQYLINQILEHWEPLINTKIRYALGEYYTEEYKEGKRFVYKALPDSKSINDLLIFVTGSPTLRVNATVDSPQLKELGDKLRKLLEGRKAS